MTIARNIRKLRNDLNMTQSELAEKANLSLPGIQAIEAKERMPRVETLQKIADALGAPVSDLYLDDDKKSAPTESPDRASRLILEYPKANFDKVTLECKSELRTCNLNNVESANVFEDKISESHLRMAHREDARIQADMARAQEDERRARLKAFGTALMYQNRNRMNCISNTIYGTTYTNCN